jgi:hypothetical protein
MTRKLLALGALGLALGGCPTQNLVENCGDGQDNDGNGQTDCEDADCAAFEACLAEVCDDGVDNNGNGDIDCAEATCAGQAGCLEQGNCADNQDNDLDGQTDCDDADCDAAANCREQGNCSDLEDNDGDGQTDCDDADCDADPACQVGNNCNDGVDNDGDILVDAADPACIAGEADEATNDNQCTDNIDNDFDGAVDECGAAGREADAARLSDLTLLGPRDLVFTDQNNNPTANGQPLITIENNVSSNDPEFKEGCFTGTGTRKTLRWNTIIKNVGDGNLNTPNNLIVGDTSDHQPLWNNNNQLGGLQFSGWTRSFLLDAAGNVVASGHKPSFCMIDFDPQDTGIQQNFNDCGNGQGITEGLADIYNLNLACQFIDITNVPPAPNYTLRVEVNFTHQLPESDYTNNVTEFSVVVP